ncbi:MAG: hypothetical protein ACREX9_16270 [Gammaproteobacteria bacterium]
MARDSHIYGEIDSTRGDGRAIIPKVKRVYIAGELSNWEGWYHQKAQRPSGSMGVLMRCTPEPPPSPPRGLHREARRETCLRGLADLRQGDVSDIR